MATIYLSLSTKENAAKQKEILLRFTHGPINQRTKTNIFILAEYWNDKTQGIIIPKFRLMNEDQKQLRAYLTMQNERLNTLVATIHTSFNSVDKDSIASDWLKLIVDKFNFPEKYIPKVEQEQPQSFFECFEECVRKRLLSDERREHYKVVIRAFNRYELYIRKTVPGQKGFTLCLDTISPDTIQDFSTFLTKEHEIFNVFPEIYDEFPQYQKPKPRGQNTINGILTKVRTFFIWAVENNKTINNPFKKFSVAESVYGTPYYITVEERNKLHRTDFSHKPALEIQRDIFVFQCLIGCRVSDLYKLTKANVINGAVEYIAGKTKDDRPITVRVPLNSIAKDILSKYADYKGERLLPFIRNQDYNEAIREAFTLAKLTRKVTVLDTLTKESIVKPLNLIASSHLARRSFVGNLYRQVKDPNLVGALSGHKEGSRAFARYRDIDEQMKTDLVKLLE